MHCACSAHSTTPRYDQYKPVADSGSMRNLQREAAHDAGARGVILEYISRHALPIVATEKSVVCLVKRRRQARGCHRRWKMQSADQLSFRACGSNNESQ